MKKAYYFTLDAALSLLLVVFVLKLSLNVFVSSPEITSKFTSVDIARVLNTLQIGELELDYVQELIANNTIVNLNNTVAEQIGEFWSVGNKSLARKMLSAFTAKYIPSNVDYSVLINNEMIFNTSLQEGNRLMSSTRMISGITSGRKRTGYVARAVAIKARKNTTLVKKGDIISSSVMRKKNTGTNQNYVHISYYFTLPQDAIIHDAYWFVEASYTTTHFKAYVNGNSLSGASSQGEHLFDDIKYYLTPGLNNATLVFWYGNQAKLGGDDGATHLVVKYETNATNTLSNFRYHYFAEVHSNCSIRYKKPIFAVGNITSMTVNLSVNATNVTLYFNFEGTSFTIGKKQPVNSTVVFSNSEILATLSANGLSYTNLTNSYFWFIVDVDNFHEREEFGQHRAIYNSSYVYTEMDLPSFVYGYIDITVPLNLSHYSNRLQSDFYRYVRWNFSVSDSEIPLFVDSQLAWLYYTFIPSPSQEVSANGVVLYKHPPKPFISEFTRFGYGNKSIKRGSNNYSLSFGYGYGVNPFHSLATYTLLIRNFVPYGETFDTREEALSDAIERLNDTLSDYTKAIGISSDVNELGSVPSLWGPAILEVRTW